MSDHPPHVTAARDQFLASMRTFAEMSIDVRDAFITAGFDRDEAMELLVRYLEMAHDHADD